MSGDSSLPVLAVNAGSSSLKFGLYLVSAGKNQMLVSGMADVGDEHYGALSAKDADGKAMVSDERPVGAPHEAISRIADLLAAQGLPIPLAIGHRIVHGGPSCRRHTLIDATVMQQLEAAKVFAPLHVPPALALVRAAQERFPGLPQAACLDTAFHTTMPDVARTLPIPRELRTQGIERYGFHGLSYESIVRQLGEDVPHRLVIAHLGNGASVTAVADGRSIDTSMGLTPAGGVIMSTRCGDIDPGVIVYVVRELRYNASDVEALIDHRSGLYGISGVSGDMRELRASAASNEDARLAIEMFCYSMRKQIAAMAAALGGTDLLVFTGGIGENDALTRASICKGLEGLGIGTEPEPHPHGKCSRQRSTRGANSSVLRCMARVIPSQEDEQIAQITWQLTHWNSGSTR
ncbi:MAG: acetate/propionate family kinase [Luteimonas sp.]